MAPTSGRDSEQAPLLADDALNGDGDSNIDDGDEERTKQQRLGNWLARIWHWCLENLMAIAIILLLIGGIVALSVYFAGSLTIYLRSEAVLTVTQS